MIYRYDDNGIYDSKKGMHGKIKYLGLLIFPTSPLTKSHHFTMGKRNYFVFEQYSNDFEEILAFAKHLVQLNPSLGLSIVRDNKVVPTIGDRGWARFYPELESIEWATQPLVAQTPV